MDPDYFWKLILIRTRIRAKRWIRICIKVIIKKLWRLKKTDLRRAVDAYTGGLEVRNGALESLYCR
jgi:hypothetical protein